jgi:hypothetical protein
MPAFWSDELGGYNLEAGVPQVFTSYGAWTSLGHLALYEAEGDEQWLRHAQVNADAMAARLRAPDGSYAVRSYVCRDRSVRGCESEQTRTARDPTIDTAAQAWAQHLEARLANAVLED